MKSLVSVEKLTRAVSIVEEWQDIECQRSVMLDAEERHWKSGAMTVNHCHGRVADLEFSVLAPVLANR